MHKNKTIVVTGGSTGIGLKICQGLVDSGYTVVNLARRSASFEHPELHNYAVDLSDKDAVAELSLIHI